MSALSDAVERLEAAEKKAARTARCRYCHRVDTLNVDRANLAVIRAAKDWTKRGKI